MATEANAELATRLQKRDPALVLALVRLAGMATEARTGHHVGAASKKPLAKPAVVADDRSRTLGICSKGNLPRDGWCTIHGTAPRANHPYSCSCMSTQTAVMAAAKKAVVMNLAWAKKAQGKQGALKASTVV